MSSIAHHAPRVTSHTSHTVDRARVIRHVAHRTAPAGSDRVLASTAAAAALAYQPEKEEVADVEKIPAVADVACCHWSERDCTVAVHSADVARHCVDTNGCQSAVDIDDVDALVVETMVLAGVENFEMQD